nr:hypothetical protein CFP56_00207 [Quercus suber]
MENIAAQAQVYRQPGRARSGDGIELVSMNGGGSIRLETTDGLNARSSTITRWWRKHITPDVALEQCRDYLALSPPEPRELDAIVGFFKLGRPLGATSIALAIVILMIGAYRCWHQQQNMTRGKVMARGWELWTITSITFIVRLSVFLSSNRNPADHLE